MEHFRLLGQFSNVHTYQYTHTHTHTEMKTTIALSFCWSMSASPQTHSVHLPSMAISHSICCRPDWCDYQPRPNSSVTRTNCWNAMDSCDDSQPPIPNRCLWCWAHWFALAHASPVPIRHVCWRIAHIGYFWFDWEMCICHRSMYLALWLWLRRVVTIHKLYGSIAIDWDSSIQHIRWPIPVATGSIWKKLE